MKPLYFILACGVLVVSAGAQTIILKDGKVVATKGVRRDGDTIMATIEIALPVPPIQSGQPSPPAQPPRTGEIGYPISQIAKVDFPEPAQLKSAAELINAGKATDALKQIEPVLAYYESVRDTPGSWWADALTLKIQALSSQARNEEAERLAEQMARTATDPETIRTAKVYVAAGLARKGDYAKALSICELVLNEAIRPLTLAQAAVVNGQCHLARREWEPALLSLLEVPVFYPRQETLIPCVLLNTARAYIGLDDLARARTSLNELETKFASTPDAAQGKKELDRIARLEKSPSPPR
jgi:tetratricopeptide (TPR) repeat protein